MKYINNCFWCFCSCVVTLLKLPGLSRDNTSRETVTARLPGKVYSKTYTCSTALNLTGVSLLQDYSHPVSLCMLWCQLVSASSCCCVFDVYVHKGAASCI